MTAIRPIRKVLVANRGEIAVRVMRSCREMGIQTAAIFSEADRTAFHVRFANEAYCVGAPPSRESYLKIGTIIDVARRCQADAIHPGYGFLSENAEFSEACEKAGIKFIGPRPHAIFEMGEKVRARSHVSAAGVPVVPGTPPLETVDAAAAAAEKMGFPVMLKAAAGGGGKGMRRVDGAGGIKEAFLAATGEAVRAFGDGRVYMEKYLEKPRHVEFQVLADSFGDTIHVFERECSVQRRHQKVIEETPSPIVDEGLRERMGKVAVAAARSVQYEGAGTVEFLVDAHKNFYFLEMNTRLQVEHPVTECVAGVDLVRAQILVAEGRPLPFKQADLRQRGHAIEARVCAEDPQNGFIPSPGFIEFARIPDGPGTRTDAGIYSGYEVPSFYDTMIAKLIAWDSTRELAIRRLDRALAEFVIRGITTNIQYLRSIIAQEAFQSGEYDTGFIEKYLKNWEPGSVADSRTALIAAAVLRHRKDMEFKVPVALAAGPRNVVSAWARASRPGRP